MTKRDFFFALLGLTASLAAGYWLGQRLIGDFEGGRIAGLIAFFILFWRKYLPKSREARADQGR
jgi:hypothetical protein